MENQNNKDENNKLENNICNNDSDIYANPFSSNNEKEKNNVNEKEQKENGINENLNNDKNLKENEKPEIQKNDNEKIDDNNKDINNKNNVQVNEKINQINEEKKKEKKKEENKLDHPNTSEQINNINNNKKINNTVKPSETNNNQNKNTNIEKKPKPFIIKETGSNIYIENIKKMSSMAIEKSFNKIYAVKDINEMLHLNLIKSFTVDAVLGIIDINGNNKYILVVTSSKLIANIISAEIYNILEVDLIKITLFNESENEKNRITGIKTLFKTKNFYYSNQIDLCQNLFIKNRKNIINDFCVNSSLLKYFFDNLISPELYTKIIYGYVGFKKNTEIKNDNNLLMVDNLIIERVNKHLKFNSDIANHMKQIEFICMYKQHNINTINKNKYNINIFTFIFYVSNEIANNNVPFNPWNNFIMNELSKYPNIVCVIHNNINMNLNYNININNNSIKNIIYNNNQLGSKIKLLNFTSDWKKNLFFDNNNNSNNFIISGSINPNHIQDYVFWFIDINNQLNENDYCFNTIIRLMWKAIQQQIDFMNLGINIGSFNKNNNEIICSRFKDFIMDYHNDLDINKKSIYKSQMKKQLQKVFDYYFNNLNKTNNSKTNVYEKNYNNIQNNNKNNNLDDKFNFNKNNFNAYQNINQIQNNNNSNNSNNFANPFLNNQNIQMNQKQKNFVHSHTQNLNTRQLNNMKNNMNNNMNNNINMNKPTIPKQINVLCITWNVGGINSENIYNIKDLFTHNIFYPNSKIPDIIIIGLQEIVELDIYSVLTITSNEDSVSNWTNIIKSVINSLFPYTFKQISIQHLIGIYSICFVQSYLKENIDIINTKVVKTGLFGTLGNKGYMTLNIRLFKSFDISFAVGHLEAGKSSNDQRISTLKQILETRMGKGQEFGEERGKKFKNSDIWIILGDLNFRIEESFERSIELIQRREYEKLVEFDQLYLCRLKDGGLIDVNEAKINFPPTYKYQIGTNNYLSDEEYLRTPSWTDRILFCYKNNIRNLSYSDIPSIKYSDHKPVYACFEIDIPQQNRIDNNNFNNNNINSNRNNNNFANPFLGNFNNNINNNTYIGNNNYNMNNPNSLRNNNNFNDFANNFGNNNNNNQIQGNWNQNNYNNIKSHRNYNYTDNLTNQRNYHNFNNNPNNVNNMPNNNYINNNNNQMIPNNINNNDSNQRTNSSDKNNQKNSKHGNFNRNKTFIDPRTKEPKNDNKNDEDNIENMMKFFK